MLKEGLIYIMENVDVVSSSIYQAFLSKMKVSLTSETAITNIRTNLPAFGKYKFEFIGIKEIRNRCNNNIVLTCLFYIYNFFIFLLYLYNFFLNFKFIDVGKLVSIFNPVYYNSGQSKRKQLELLLQVTYFFMNI